MPNDTYTDIRRLLAEAASDVRGVALEGDRAVRRARRRAFVSVSVACLAALAVAAGSLQIVRASGSNESIPLIAPPVTTAHSLVNVTDGSVSPFEVPDGARWLRFSPDGASIIFVDDDAEGLDQIFSMRTDGSQVKQLTIPGEWASAADEPAWSPDGDWIAYSGVTDSGRHAIVAMQSNGYHPPRAQLSWGASDARTPSWSADGSYVAFVSDGIRVMHARYYAGGDSITSDRPGLILDAGTSPAWSPDGGVIAFTSGAGSERGVAIANDDGSDVRDIAPATSDRPIWSPDGHLIAYNVWTSDEDVAVWLYEPATGRHQLLLNGASVESWQNDETLLVSTQAGN
jgi:Tol biopolymer transport system component